MIDLLSQAAEKYRKKPLLRHVDGTAIIVGDLHGDINALEKIEKIWKEEDTKYLILLGDYVDRGKHQIEVVKKIAELVLEHDNFIALRGNHEDYQIYSRYGFLEILQDNELESDLFNKFFSQLPIAAKSHDVFMVHGGIPVDPNFDINDIKDFERSFTLNEENLKELLWNDPIYDDLRNLNEYKTPSRRGAIIWNFGIPRTQEFFDTFGINLLIRAHTALFEGHLWMQDKRILSLFTSSSGVYRNYKRHLAKIDFKDPHNLEIIELPKK